MERVDLRLTEPQARKLMRGGVVQLTPEALRDNAHYLVLGKKMASKVKRAQKAGRGCRVCLSPEEMQHSGEGIGDFFKKIKKGAKWVKDKVIDTPFYQENVKPLVRKGVDAALSLAAPSLGPAAPLAMMAAEKFGQVSGAYGLEQGEGLREDIVKAGKKAGDFYQKHAKKYVAPHLRKAVQSAEKSLVARAKKMAPQFATDIDKLHEEYGEKAVTAIGSRTGAFGLRRGRGLANNYSNFLAPDHPAMRPIMPNLPPIGGWVYMHPDMFAGPKGGSFKVSGAGRGRGRRGFGKTQPYGGSFMPSGP